MNGSGGKMTEYVPKNSTPNSDVSFSSSCGTVPFGVEETEREVATGRSRGLRATALRDRHEPSIVGQLVLVVVVMSY
jgi:hypothetical protein